MPKSVEINHGYFAGRTEGKVYLIVKTVRGEQRYKHRSGSFRFTPEVLKAERFQSWESAAYVAMPEKGEGVIGVYLYGDDKALLKPTRKA